MHNMSSSKTREVLWALEELADAGIKYNVVNLRWGRVDTYKVLKSQFPLGKSPTVTLEHINRKSEATYQILCKAEMRLWPRADDTELGVALLLLLHSPSDYLPSLLAGLQYRQKRPVEKQSDQLQTSHNLQFRRSHFADAQESCRCLHASTILPATNYTGWKNQNVPLF